MSKSRNQKKPKHPEVSKTPRSKDSKNATKSPAVSRTPQPSKIAKNLPKVEDKAPEVPEIVKNLKKHGLAGGGISWQIEKQENQKTDNKRRPKTVCYRYDEKYMLVKYGSHVTLQKIDAPRNTTTRLAMIEANIYPKRGFSKYDEITEVPDSEEDAEVDPKVKEKENVRREEMMRMMMKLEKKEKESKAKAKDPKNMTKEVDFKKSFYLLEELNERSCYYVEKSSKRTKPSEKLEAVKTSSEKTEKDTPKDPKSTESSGKVTGGLKDSAENKLQEKAPEPAQSSYVCQGFKQSSDYCSSAMKSDGENQKKSTNSVVSNTQDFEGKETENKIN